MAGQMAQQLSTVPILIEDHRLVPTTLMGTHTMACNFRGSSSFFLLVTEMEILTHTDMHAHRQK